MAVISRQWVDNLAVKPPQPQPTSRTLCGLSKATLLRSLSSCSISQDKMARVVCRTGVIVQCYPSLAQTSPLLRFLALKQLGEVFPGSFSSCVRDLLQLKPQRLARCLGLIRIEAFPAVLLVNPIKLTRCVYMKRRIVCIHNFH